MSGTLNNPQFSVLFSCGVEISRVSDWHLKVFGTVANKQSTRGDLSNRSQRIELKDVVHQLIGIEQLVATLHDAGTINLRSKLLRLAAPRIEVG